MSRTFAMLSDGVQQTRHVGQLIGRHAAPDGIVGLTGSLGAGKTQVAKGIAEGLEVRDSACVNSPTFVIVNEYEGRLHMYHVDVYRLGDASELELLGFDEMCHSGGLVVVEWADKIARILPEDHLSLHLEVVGADTRKLTFTAGGHRSESLVAWHPRADS